MFQVILIIVSLVLAKVDVEKINREDLKKTIFKGCMKMSNVVADKKKKICKCVVLNFDKKSNDYQLKLLAENYRIPKKDEAEEPVIISTAVETFDFEVSSECIKDHRWRLQDKKK